MFCPEKWMQTLDCYLGSIKASSSVSPSGDGWGRKRRQPRKAKEWNSSPEIDQIRTSGEVGAPTFDNCCVSCIDDDVDIQSDYCDAVVLGWVKSKNNSGAQLWKELLMELPTMLRGGGGAYLTYADNWSATNSVDKRFEEDECATPEDWANRDHHATKTHHLILTYR